MEVVGAPKISATDEDVSDTPTFSFVDVAGSSTPATVPEFMISSTGAITVLSSLNHEDKSSYTLYVLASDRTGSTLTPVTVEVTITIGNVDEPPSVNIELTSSSEVLTDFVGVVANIIATDPEGETLIYTLTGDRVSNFEIDETTTPVTIRKTSDIQYGSLSSTEEMDGVLLTVSVTDNSTLPVTEDVRIMLQDPGTPAFGDGSYSFVQAENTICRYCYDRIEYNCDRSESSWS